MKNLIIGVLVVALLGIGYAYLDQGARFGALPQSGNLGNMAFASVSATQGLFTLGPIAATTSTVTSTVSLGRGLAWGLKQGDGCDVELSSMSSTLGFSADAFITAIAQYNSTVTVTFYSGQQAGNVTIATGTLSVYCKHF